MSARPYSSPVRPHRERLRRHLAQLTELLQDPRQLRPLLRVGGNRLHRRMRDLRLQLGGSALGHYAPVVDDADAVGEHVGLLQILRGEEDRDAVLLREPSHLGPESRAGLRVEPGRGLVQEEDPRPVHEGQRQVEAALHPTRVRLDLALGRRLEADPLQQLVRPALTLFTGDAVQRRLQAQVLAARQQRVERGFLQRGSDRRPHLRALLDDIEACHPGSAVSRRQQRRQHVDGRALARAVRSQEPVDLAFGDDEVDAVHCADVLELADEPLRLDAVRHLPTLATR